MNERIPVLVIPHCEIDCVGLDRTDGDHFMSCWVCGSPYLLVKIETVRESEWSKRHEIPIDQLMLGSIDHTFYCAVCGSSNGGIFVDNEKGTSEKIPISS